jgi:cysteine-rich repeat protein
VRLRALQNISLSDWESGLGSWNSTFTAVNAASFSTPPWAVVGSLPDSRAGQAAFVANVDSGDCVADDESGVLRLLSPVILTPAGTAVPRISIDHWFEIEPGWDGGNLRIKVNGSSFNLVPESAIEMRPYNTTLKTALDEFGDPYNTNPLADQRAFTGTDGGVPTGRWGQTRINLSGIASAGDSIQLRFDFGVDCALGDVGWYVDDVQFYSCAAELPPSTCGNQVINGGEQCDDGNNYIGDGCSNTCQIENGWACTAPTPAGSVKDPSFEKGRLNPDWDEVSNNPFGSPICRTSDCGFGGGSGPSDGTWWAWFGGIKPYQEGSLAQSVGIPVTATQWPSISGPRLRLGG